MMLGVRRSDVLTILGVTVMNWFGWVGVTHMYPHIFIS
jgi:hypothetical protein